MPPPTDRAEVAAVPAPVRFGPPPRETLPLGGAGGDTADWDRQLCTLSRGRLRVTGIAPGRLRLRDRLRPGSRTLDAPGPPHPADPRQTLVELLRLGFLDAVLPAASRPVGAAPVRRDDCMFWQFPARTEAAAFDRHAELPHAVSDGSAVHVYLGLPWATWIDRTTRRGTVPVAVEHELLMQRVRIGGFRRVLRALGADLRVHTVCQHVGFRPWLPAWRRLGVTDLWLSHAPPVGTRFDAGAPRLHPWHLYAVNVEDAGRRQGLVVGRDPEARRVLASFVGAHDAHYLSDTRLRLRALAGQDGFEIRVTEGWHFEDVVYRRQIDGDGAAPAGGAGAAVERYNALLSDSVFSLCPAGAGPNTLRLWESLAVGAVPVLLGPAPRLPEGGTLPPIDWDRIVLRVADEQIPDLPRLLSAVPIDERRRRQQLGLQAYAQVRAQRCF
jgi:hypothetical protein